MQPAEQPPTEVETPLPCIACGKKLEPAVSGAAVPGVGNVNQPYAGTAFKTYGHYGSTVFDPPGLDGGTWLEISVCDDCLIKKAAARLVLKLERRYQASPPPRSRYWDPTEESR